MFSTRLITHSSSLLSPTITKTTTSKVLSSRLIRPTNHLPFPSARYCSSSSVLGASSRTTATATNPTQLSSNTTTSSTTITTRSSSSSSSSQKEPDNISMYLKETHDRVFAKNRSWAAEQVAKDPDFFRKISAGQNPEYLWIGCSDSRIPAEQITGLQPGEAFVHRNIANLVCNTDLNAMSVIEYAVQHLQVKHIVVCGHYGCGGVKAAMTAQDLGILNPWLRNIRDIYRLHEKELDAIQDEAARCDRLVELNVIEQCRNIIKTATVQKSYAKDSFPVVHGWVFDFRDGLLKDLNVDFEAVLHDIQKIYNLTGSK